MLKIPQNMNSMFLLTAHQIAASIEAAPASVRTVQIMGSGNRDDIRCTGEGSSTSNRGVGTLCIDHPTVSVNGGRRSLTSFLHRMIETVADAAG